MTPKELIEAIKNRPVTEADVKAFEARCRAREEQFAKEADRMKPDADWYRFRYGVKNNKV